MSSFSQTYTNSTSVTIPAFAESISVTVAASSGAGGGRDDVYTGGSGGFGRVGTFTLPNSIGRTLSFSISSPGFEGGDSPSGAPRQNSPGGPGGGGVASGGTGGSAGPIGTSGGGGGGGGATGVYDSYSNSWIIVAGGGGGGGGAAFPDVPGLDGNAGQGWAGSGGNVSTISNGGGGGNCPTDGSGGGGGGGGASGGFGGNNGFDVDAGNVRAGGGGGGGSGYRSSFTNWTGASFLNSGNGYVTLTYTLSPPSISFTASPNPIVQGNSTTLSWNVTGSVTSVSISPSVGSVSSSGSTLVSPTSTTNYTLTASGPGGTSSQLITVTVYQPPQTTLSVDDASIIRGACTTLRWVTTGDATSATINQGIGAVNINGLRTICPTETTTYQINVGGLGGSDSDSVTLTVYQPPTVSLVGPTSLNYDQQGTLTYEATNADISLVVQPSFNYKNGVVNGSMFNVNLPVGSSSSGTTPTNITYNDFGPFSVTYTIVATGNGGQETKQITVPINVDETPQNFIIPESEDLLKDQDPVYTPDSTITSYQIVIDNIDIPVEVKADRPIQIEVNDDDQWNNLRQI